ncbi:MAG: Asp-tRNA(Asn)/Glu-tRNA(Gln) amidotransferase subunit GatC [Thermodesulfobacteriota bacterium]
MGITKKDVAKVAALARLELTKEEEDLYTEQIGRILAYVEQLGEVDTEGVEPTTYTVPMRRVFREDEVRPSLPHDDALRNAPEEGRGCFRVPKVIE